MKVIPETRHSH